MFKKIFFAIVFQGSAMVFAQEGVLKIQVIDSINGDALEGAGVLVESAGITACKGLTNELGNLVFKNLAPGEYTVKTSYVGYPKDIMTGVLIKNHEATYLDIKLSTEVKKEFVFRVYKKPLINPIGSNKITYDFEEIKRSPLDPMTLISNGTGAVVQKEGMSPSFHGARPTSNVILIDGQRVIGSSGLPRMGIEQISVTLGGVPAQFGDGTGGFIEIETRSGLVNHNR